jgi:hypothetical protein
MSKLHAEIHFCSHVMYDCHSANIHETQASLTTTCTEVHENLTNCLIADARS